MRKILLYFIFYIAFFFLLSSCQKGNESTNNAKDANDAKSTGDAPKTSSKKKSGDIEIGIVLPTKLESRWIQDEQRFKNMLAESNRSVEILFSEGSASVERKNVETLITKGIKVLIICPPDASAAAASVEEAKKSDITVISYDRLITDTDAVDYYISFNSWDVGRAQAGFLVRKLEESGETGVPLYIYAGAASDNNAFLFFEGAWEILQPKIASGDFVIQNSSKAVEYQDIAKLERGQMSDIIEQVTTNWDANTAKVKAETDSADASGTVYILTPNDDTARPIFDVFSTVTGVEKVYTTGQDAEKPTIQYIIDGKQSMTVLKDVRKLVKYAIDAALAVLDGNPVETTTTFNNKVIDVPAISVPVVEVNQENVKEVIIDSEYYPASEFTLN